jgi:7-carboxy-7-deazaguanine synthase (Cx14CxxC type)
MSYHVKEIFYSLQGEGMHAGRPAVFCRFTGCNLWSGREEDRNAAVCRFCDTQFTGTDGPGGGLYQTAADLARAVASAWPSSASPAAPFVVCTGGEPLLQMNDRLVQAFHDLGMVVAIETNGTLPAFDGIDWICVSPKPRTKLAVTSGDELKLVFPQEGSSPADYASLDFPNFFLQPMDGPKREENTRRAVEYCLAHPQWRLSIQLHKVLGLP